MAEAALDIGPNIVVTETRPRAIELIGNSARAARLDELVRRAAQAEAGVLVVGEAGADVNSVARDVVGRSNRAQAPWIEVECAADDAGALETALFGGTAHNRPSDLETVSTGSLIAAARGGALFLRDVADLPASSQSRLARIARDREVRVAGEPIATNMRILASASPAIDADVREGKFRTDLYRRLAALRIDVPALRDRAEDVPELAQRLLAEMSGRGAVRMFTQAALALLGALSWPGNLAELRAVVARAHAVSADGAIQVEHVLPALQLNRAQMRFAPTGSLREARQRFEREYIASVLQHHGWRMAEAAQTLGIQRPNLYRKARQLGIPVARAAE